MMINIAGLSHLVPAEAEKSYSVYRLIITAAEEDMEIDAQYWLRNQLIRSEKTRVHKWYFEVGSLSSYLSSSFDFIKKLDDQSLFTFGQTIEFVGLKLWDLINQEPQFKEVWAAFKRDVGIVTDDCWIVITGSGHSVSLPIECMYKGSEKTLFEDHPLSIIRQYSLGEISGNGLHSMLKPLPNQIVALLGKDSDPQKYGRSLDYKKEVKMWYQLLQPNRNVTDIELDEVLAFGATIKSDPIMGRILTLEIVPNGNLRHLEQVVKDLNGEPFLFLYSGHGEYQGSMKSDDGHIRWSEPHQFNDTMGSTEILVSILKGSSVQGIFLHCCEGFRNVEFLPAFGGEHQYFSSLKELSVLLGFRSKILDQTGQLFSAYLFRSILEQQTILEFIFSIRRREVSTPIIDPRKIRDLVSRFIMVR